MDGSLAEVADKERRAAGQPAPPHIPPDSYSTLYIPSDFSQFAPQAQSQHPQHPAQVQAQQQQQSLYLQHHLQPQHGHHQQFQQLEFPAYTAHSAAAAAAAAAATVPLDLRMQASQPPPQAHHQQQLQHAQSPLPPPGQMHGDPQQQQQQQQQQPGALQSSDDPGPPPFAGSKDGRLYRLSVKQEPVRARMCGFGDKDRRPITPPPCVLLEVIDEKTGRNVDINELDPTYFVMTVDLWSHSGMHEVNLVRHSATSPSISATTASSYPPQALPPQTFPFGGPMGMPQQQQYGYPPPPPPQHHQQQPQHHQQQPQHGGPPQYAPAPYGADPNRPYYSNATTPMTPMTPTHPAYQNGVPQMVITQDPRSAPSGMFTRNLIGSLSVSAFKLTNTADELGIWFILQDLSVRTEGVFRLKFSFVNVGVPGSSTVPVQLNTGSAPVLATCFSQPFQVFSAKKFPGVIESTQLSKCFAGQGIKIPIRKDGNGRMHDDDD